MAHLTVLQRNFLSKPQQLGVVCVGFSGGQVDLPSAHFWLKFTPFSTLNSLRLTSFFAHIQCKPGVDAGPTALIEAGLLDQLRSDLGYKVHHDGQVHNYSSHIPSSDPPHRGMRNPRTVSAVTQQLEAQVYEQAAEGRLVLTLGGDHSIAIGTIAGSSRAIKERLGREIAVIWVDAHADINTPEISDSGSVHGMPLSFLTGIAKEEDESMFGWLNGRGKKGSNGLDVTNGSGVARAGAGVGVDRLGERITNGGEGTNAAEGVLSTKKLVYIGLRDVDKGEKEILRKYGVKAFSMHDIDKCVSCAPSS